MRRALSIAAVLALVSLPLVAMAAGGGGHDDHHGPPSGAQWLMVLFTAVNFSIFGYLLWRFAKDPLRDFLGNRRAELAAALSAASEAKAEADRLRSEYEAKLADLDETRKAMVEELRGVAEADAEKAVKEAAEAAERMRQEAERTAQHDFERARRELRAEAARLAAELASGEISARLTEEDRGRLLDELIAGVTKQ